MSQPQTMRRPMPPLAELTDRLRRQSRKITGPRQAILDSLRQQVHPLSCQEVFASLPGRQCNLVTVYRSLHLLERLGLVQRFDFGDGVARFALLPDGEKRHRHHLICTRCFGMVEVAECLPSEWEQSLAVRSGFRAITHRLEFFGICPACQ